jgi:hypothetical protein
VFTHKAYAYQNTWPSLDRHPSLLSAVASTARTRTHLIFATADHCNEEQSSSCKNVFNDSEYSPDVLISNGGMYCQIRGLSGASACLEKILQPGSGVHYIEVNVDEDL